jgi:photosystem II stability/assembly factor-like uncharacterized protein
MKIKISILFLLCVFLSRAQWTLVPSPTTVNLTSIHFGCDSVGFIGGRNFPSLTQGTLLRTDNRGNSWIQLDTCAYNSLHCMNKDTFFAARPAVICSSFDGGETIVPLLNSAFTVSNNVPEGQYFSVYTRDKRTVSYGGHIDVQPPASGSIYSLRKGTFAHYRNFFNGLPTLTDYHPTITGICFVDSMNGYFCGVPCVNNNTIIAGSAYKTTDGGQTWNVCIQTYSATWNTICFVNTNIGFVASASGQIRKTTDGGYHWDQVYNGGINIKSIYFTDASNGCAVGDQGLILGTEDGGTTWVKQYSGTTNRLRSVYFTSITTGFIVGDNGTILKTTHGAVGLKENNSTENNFTIYPDPASDKLFFSKKLNADFKIKDLCGREILSGRNSETGITVSGLTKGMYFIELSSENGVYRHSFIKE